MRLQDPAYTRVLLVTLAETTPVSQANALQEDLRRAHIEPYAWVVNKSLLAAGTRDPLLRQRLLGEQKTDRSCAWIDGEESVLRTLAGDPASWFGGTPGIGACPTLSAGDPLNRTSPVRSPDCYSPGSTA